MAIILTIGIISGILLLGYGTFFIRPDEEKVILAEPETINMLKQSVEDADMTLSNINSVSSLIIEEIDIKYKELLFLYQMMEEKKKEILEHTVFSENEETDKYDDEMPTLPPLEVPEEYKRQAVFETNLDIMEIGMKMDEIKKFPKLRNKETILEMHANGRDITDIAKELGIGKGEVQLIIGLSKVGVGNE